MSFLANCSPLIFLWLIIGFFYLLFLVLSNRKLIKNKLIRRISKKIIKHRFRLHVLHDVFWVTFIYTLFFALYQIKVVSFSTAKDIVNFFFAMVVLIVYVGVAGYILKLGNKYK